MPSDQLKPNSRPAEQPLYGPAVPQLLGILTRSPAVILYTAVAENAALLLIAKNASVMPIKKGFT